jgi:hypothetical protein
MQQIIGGMQDDYNRLTCAFDKSVVANFPSHKIETKENTHDPSSAANWYDQSQPLYRMSMNTSPKQPHPPTQIGGKNHRSAHGQAICA